MKSAALSTSFRNTVRSLIIILMINIPALAACAGVEGQSTAITETTLSTNPTISPDENLPVVKVVPDSQLDQSGLPIDTVDLTHSNSEKHNPSHKNEGALDTNLRFTGLNLRARS